LTLVENELSKKLGQDAFEYTYDKVQKEVIWKNRTRWARQHLKEKGQIDGSVMGIWTLTDKGRQRLDLLSKEGVDPDQNLLLKKEIINPLTQKLFTISRQETVKKSEETTKIESIIREMVLADRNVINMEIVRAVNEKLNIVVDKKRFREFVIRLDLDPMTFSMLPVER
jgi:hypothetical protein